MLRIFEISVNKQEAFSKERLAFYVVKNLGIKENQIDSFKISRRSIDARKKNNICYKFNFDVMLKPKTKINPICKFKEIEENKPESEKVNRQVTVVVVGSGPSGIFCALTLAKAGVKVFLLERGKCVEERVKDVQLLLEKGIFNKDSNIQFGEGGAGTFSDGKLNTGTNSPLISSVLQTFYENGADEDVLYDAKPHVGTDKLREVVVSMRKQFEALGGIVLFESKFTDFRKIGGKMLVKYLKNEENHEILCDDLVLALGYSARETFKNLYEKGLNFAQKPFSVGFRIEHLQKDINKAQYGTEEDKFLPPADYKLFHHLENGRTVYTFCMCPGGVVVPANSEENQICTNGMSYHLRDKENANSAVLVSVSEKDYQSEHPLAGMFFQENLEKQAFIKGQGKYLYSRFADFEKKRECERYGKVKPSIGINGKAGNCYSLLPDFLSDSIIEGIHAFAKKLKGFDNPDAVLTGIETRSSAPFMIFRDENNQTNISNVYAVGEGAGRAGGIVSSAVDGIKIAQSIIEKYKG